MRRILFPPTPKKEEMKTVMVKCPGGRIRSKGRGKGLGRGKRRGPIGKPNH